MDVEGAEWKVLKSISDEKLFPKIGQLMLEMHINSLEDELAPAMDALDRNGLELFYRVGNWRYCLMYRDKESNARLYGCQEVSYINSKKSF